MAMTERAGGEHAESGPRAGSLTKAINLFAVLLPVVGLVVAIVLLWGVAFNWVYLVLLVGMYLITALGITVGYHRLFTHKSYDTPQPVAIVLAAMGSMAAEGPLFQWVGTHRKHHQHSDKADDPHSPHTHGGTGVWATLRGLWHAHVGWLFKPYALIARRRSGTDNKAGLARYVADLEKDRGLRWMSKTFPIWVLVGLAIPTALGGLIVGTWTGALLGLLWGGLVRILLLHHVTWSINSVCHIWGTKPFRSHDESRNNGIFGVLALGEGWHNNHHAFPTSARHGLRWWELDASYVCIWLMSKIGLASNVRVPSPARVAEKRNDPQDSRPAA